MSRPNISYPTPIPGPSSYSASTQRPTNGLDPSPFGRDSIAGQAPSAPAQPPRRQTSNSTRSGYSSALDSSITRLLVTTKQLLQGLEQWSQGIISETDVSDIYVRLGNGFEVCIQAFHRAGLPTHELDSIPNDLRACLEQCLSYEQSHETLEIYLPDIRQIIYNLLHGLKQKQAAYKRLIADRQRDTPSPPIAPAALPQPRQPSITRDPQSEAIANTEQRLSARSRTSISGSASPASANAQLPTTKVPSSSALAERATRSGLPARPAPPDAFRPPRMRAPDQNGPRRSTSPVPPPDSSQVVRHQLVDNPVPSPPPDRPTITIPSQSSRPTPPRPDRFSRDSFGRAGNVSRFSADSDLTNGSPIRSPPARTPPRSMAALPEVEVEEPPATLPPSLPVLNLPAAIEITDDPTPTPATEDSLPDVPPETRATLAALQRSDALERRASKRFSSYTFNKMLPGSPGKKSSSSIGSPQRPTRRADRVPPMPALPEGLTNAALTPSPGTETARSLSPTSANHLHANGLERPGVLERRPSSPLTIDSGISGLPGRNSSDDGSVRVVKTPEPDDISATPRPGSTASTAPTSVSVFLQIGRQVKKTTLDLPVTFSSLRLLFMERFEYDPGMEDFPDVYLRDNKTGVQFELEDMDDLKEGCVLSLNIEPLDQVKQHFDTTFATLMQEIKEMKSAMDASKRASYMTPAPSLLSVSPSTQMSRPNITRGTSDIAGPLRAGSPSPSTSKVSLGPLGPVKEAELQAQYDELQSLRRDLAIMRQLHVDFLGDTKESFTKLRAQNSAMREVVKTKMGGNRALLDNSKGKLEAQCQDTIQAVEEISDTIDSARTDAYKRFVTPSRTQIATIRADLAKAKETVEQFTRDVRLADPTWRATWQVELQRVMEEQKLLSYQTKLCEDLKNDIKDAEEMWGNVQIFIDQRAAGLGRAGSNKFTAPAAGEEEASVPNLLMEIRTKEGDPSQRLKAIEAQQRAREKEKANKVDIFEQELKQGGKKLKKTGGTEEAERQRQRRQDLALKRMMGGDLSQGLLSPQSTGGGLGLLSPNLTGPSPGPGSTPSLARSATATPSPTMRRSSSPQSPSPSIPTEESSPVKSESAEVQAG